MIDESFYGPNTSHTRSRGAENKEKPIIAASVWKGKYGKEKPGFLAGVKNLEAEVVEKWKTEAGQTAIPVDVEGADLLYVALAGAHSIVPAAAVSNATKENWTLSFFEAVNFGAFVGDPTKTKLILDQIIAESEGYKIGYEWARTQSSDYVLRHFGLYFDEWNEKGLRRMSRERFELLQSRAATAVPDESRTETEVTEGPLPRVEAIMAGIMAAVKEIKFREVYGEKTCALHSR